MRILLIRLRQKIVVRLSYNGKKRHLEKVIHNKNIIFIKKIANKLFADVAKFKKFKYKFIRNVDPCLQGLFSGWLSFTVQVFIFPHHPD